MNRKDFFKIIWTKLLKPIAITILIIYSALFLYETTNSITVNSDFFILIASTCILILSLTLITLLSLFIFKAIYNQLPNKIKIWFDISGKLLFYLYPIVLGMLLYHFWLIVWITASILAAFLLIKEVMEILKTTK
jgi:hypothetical protein